MSPLPRRQLLTSLLATWVLVTGLPTGQATATVPGAIVGSGTAYAFTAYEHGAGVEGGVFDHSEVCSSCLIDFTIVDASPGFVLVQNGAETPLVPGSYEAREFSGYFAETMNAQHDFTIVLVGVGQLVQVS